MKNEIIQVTPEKLEILIVDSLKKIIKPNEHPEYVTRKYVAEEILHCDKATVHNLTVKGVLKKYQIGVYYTSGKR